MAEAKKSKSQIAERVLDVSLPKPGVAEAMRFWHYTRPVPTDRPGASGRGSCDA